MFHCIIKLWMVLAISLVAAAALADTDAAHVQADLTTANHSILDGHVRDGLDRLVALLKQIDPAKEKDAYWQVSTTLLEYLNQLEDYASTTKIIETILAQIHDSIYSQWMQFYIGRNLAWNGKAAEGEKPLRALTGFNARDIYTPAQRAAARMLSQIEFDRGDVNQSALWMRRAVIATLVDNGAGSEEIIDTLTDYAFFLMRTRRLADANNLFFRLAPIYDAHFAHHGPKYIRFLSGLTDLQADVGNIQGLNGLLKILHDMIAATDIAPPSAKGTIFYQDLYQLARSFSSDGKEQLKKRLEEVVSAYPDFSKQLRNRVILAYFALLSDNVDLADQILPAAAPITGEPQQYQAYMITLRSLIAARRDHFSDSLALARDAMDKIRLFHDNYENESASHLPAISIEERVVLSAILALNTSHVSTYDDANILFRLGQFLNRDKGKLGLNKKLVQSERRSDLEREETRSRDRLQELRDQLMYNAVDAMLARAVPMKPPSVSKDNDYSFLVRLEDIEDRIVTADEQLRQTSGARSESIDRPIDLAEVQRLMLPDEALVTHVVAPRGLITTCVNSRGWEIRPSQLDQSDVQQITIDTKLLMAAVRGTHEPSPDLDSSFPLESANRLFRLYLGGVSGCLKNKTHILLATDPDFFTLPWNALLTEPSPANSAHPLRDASWLPKSYAVSLLPSVHSFIRLRSNLGRSKAHQIFLGIGDPDFKGSPAPAAQLSLGPLFASRGAADSRAISELPRLPESADELRAVARVLGASPKDILLQDDATERELRKRALNDYRVISFATHAIVTGEIEGVTEPALVLSPISGENNPQNDGLLTASEIQNLTLDANLVILSACNTGAADGQAGGRGLSGLADAFFFAGTRSIAVTQWAVYSEFAQKLGMGMIAQSLKPGNPGVAHGLQQAMTSYLKDVTSDYMANPRFWAPFMIAGDGSVNPLDQGPGDIASGDSIKVEWEHTTGQAESDFTGLARSAADGSFYTIGMTIPPQGQKRSGSYIGKVGPNRNFEIIDRSPATAASNVIAAGQNLGVLGYLAKSPTSSIAEFRVLNKDLVEFWRLEESGENFSSPIGLVKTPAGYVAISIEAKYGSADGNAIVVNKLSDAGQRLTQRRYPLSFPPVQRAQNVVSDGKGRIIIAVSGDRPSSPREMWTNPQTGSKRYCTTAPETYVIAIDDNSLDVREQRSSHDGWVTAIGLFDGQIYAVSNFSRNCRVAKNLRLSALDNTLTFHTIYESNIINNVEVHDFEATPDHFILVGMVQSFTPTALTTKIMTPEQLQTHTADIWRDSFWEQNEEHLAAFILVLGSDGVPREDRVFADPLARTLARIAAESDHRFLAAGSALGGRGWLVGFSIGDEMSLTKRLQAAWRKYVILPVMELLSARSE
jgi:CHAT domain-containing protein